jgi:alpha-beta hydrolase superfamily lysophospholipase
LADLDAKFTVESFTAGDGYSWCYRRYSPDREPKAEVVAIHGIQSHGGWYTHSCERLRQAGFAVSFLDRRGAGLNEKERGDAPGFRRLLDDLAEYLHKLRVSQRETMPVALVANSWGGKLAAALQRRHPGLVDSLALLCPGFFAKVRPSAGERLSILWARLVAPQRLFPIPLNDPELFTASPARQRFIEEDSLGLRRASARMLIESFRLDGYLRFVPRYVRIPVLLMLAGKDRIIDNEKTRRFVQSFDTPDREVIEYPHAHHTLEFEPDPDVFISDLQNWLERKLPVSR